MPSSQKVEELLFAPRLEVKSFQVAAALVEAAEPYKELVQYHNELVSIANTQLKLADPKAKIIKAITR